MWSTMLIFLIFIVNSKGVTNSSEKNERQNLIPKIIWMMWDQGLDRAHLSVKLCHQSWVSKNPDHSVKLLSLEEAEDLLGMNLCKLYFCLLL